ncbi:Hippocampus abundant transcript 1 protein [Vespula squamosa]|uniref:Hippocampus abundant transcript 1 protein n=1 Tax=Vespula squamosa TaxID=30214 RepID=A0ABD2BSF6_VESSQ
MFLRRATPRIDEIEKTKESVRAVREYARQGLKEGRRHDHTKPKVHHEGWSHYGTENFIELHFNAHKRLK